MVSLLPVSNKRSKYASAIAKQFLRSDEFPYSVVVHNQYLIRVHHCIQPTQVEQTQTHNRKMSKLCAKCELPLLFCVNISDISITKSLLSRLAS